MNTGTRRYCRRHRSIYLLREAGAECKYSKKLNSKDRDMAHAHIDGVQLAYPRRIPKVKGALDPADRRKWHRMSTLHIK